jgi:hypothetical protein
MTAHAKRIVLGLAAVLVLNSGCSAHRTVARSKNDAGPEAEDIQQARIEVGDRIRVTLRRGGRISGHVQSIHPDGFTLLPRQRFHDTLKRHSAERIAFDQISSLEKSEKSWVRSILLGAVIGGALAGMYALSFYSSY